MKRMIAIDGNSILFRAYYAMKQSSLTNREGIPTGALYGFLNMLGRLKQEYPYDYVAVAWDEKGPTFRNDLFSEYKGNRKPMDDELRVQSKIIRQILDAMNIIQLSKAGYEADDILGTLARMGDDSNIETIVVTGDRDCLQLVTENTKVLYTVKGISQHKLYTPELLYKDYEMTPEEFIDYKALIGDSSDNYPGVPKVGDKTAKKILAQASIDEFLKNHEAIETPKLRKLLEEHVDTIKLSKQLATIKRDVPIDISLDDLVVKQENIDELQKLYRDMQLQTMLANLESNNKNNIDEKNTEILLDVLSGKDELKNFIDDIKGKVIIKIASNFSHLKLPKAYAISMALLDDTANIKKAILYYFQDDQEIGEIINWIKNNKRIKFIGNQLIDEYYFMNWFGFNEQNTDGDMSIAAYLLSPDRRSYSISDISSIYLGENISIESFDNIVKLHEDVKKGNDQSKQNIEKWYSNYFSVLIRAIPVLEGLLKEQDMINLYQQVELPLVSILAEMSFNGVHIDRNELIKQDKELQAKISDLSENIYELAGETFTISSPKQLSSILFEKLGIKGGKKTKTGYSTAADVLAKLKDTHPIIPKIMEYREVTKLSSTYLNGMQKYIGVDEKIRPHFMQTVAGTGRLSCTEPNLQNIPVKSQLGRNIRKAFKVEDDERILVSADYSQIELRMLAHLSKDEHLLEAFNEKKDIHKSTAMKVFHLSEDEVRPIDRSRAKAINFGVIYGMSSFGLSEELGISIGEADSYIKDYFKRFSKVKEFLDNEIASAKEKGYCTTILNRRREITQLNAKQDFMVKMGERLAMNTPIQGGAADIMKLAMIKVYNRLKKEAKEVRLILQIHDELVIETPRDLLEDVKCILKEEMESAIDLNVDLAVNVSQGASWIELK